MGATECQIRQYGERQQDPEGMKPKGDEVRVTDGEEGEKMCESREEARGGMLTAENLSEGRWEHWRGWETTEEGNLNQNFLSVFSNRK